MTEQKVQQFTGLTSEQARKLQGQFGKNELSAGKKECFFYKVLHIICEPMFLLLLVAAVIYFILGEPRDGIIMLIFVIGIISIDVIQEWKTDKTLNALKDLSAPHINVIRDGIEQTIASIDLVPGDLMLIKEGIKIPADAEIIKANDLCIDESTLTGEAEGVWKNTIYDQPQNSGYWRKDYCYCGTMVTQGSATVCVNKIGSTTEYGKIGTGIVTASQKPSPLQKQTGTLVKTCSIIAGFLFLLVAFLTFLNIKDHEITDRLIESVLSGITLAMAMIPEEFPVVLTVFLSMGAWRLAKKQSLVRKLPAVETLGAVSVLCVDKTGTLTKNQMTVCETWSIDGNDDTLIEVMGLGCETDAYDPMEKAMLAYCEDHGFTSEHLFGGELITEYAFTNEQKMMGHVWMHENEILIASKGSPERIMKLCDLSEETGKIVEEKIIEMSKKGLRVIGVAMMKPHNKTDIPETLTDCNLSLCGLIGLADPPRDSVKADIKQCINAGIRVVMITGDSGITASAIAKQIGIPNNDKIITGEELERMSDQELCEQVRNVSIFSRVIPEHKMRIIKALKENGEIVAMTGDGVNDAPALKHADIGIAMGKRGSEVSREAADLILMDDNFTTIVETIHDGRRIYDNIRKAVGYILTIHIPIAFSALLAPFLNINPKYLLLLPVHVVLLELIIDPTCSIVLERQPAEADIMNRRPRNPKEHILTKGTLIKSLLQGIVIFLASFFTYYSIYQKDAADASLARTMGLSIVILANMFLVIVNSSDHSSFLTSLHDLVRDHVFKGIAFGSVIGLIIIIYSPISSILGMTALSAVQFLTVFLIAAASVLWYEIVKILLRNNKKEIRHKNINIIK